MKRKVTAIPRYLEILEFRRQDPPKTFHEIGKELGISRQRVYQIYQRGVRRIGKVTTMSNPQDSPRKAA